MQAPGQYDVLEGTAVQLRANERSGGVQASSYQWEIVEGRGATLLNADAAVTTFVAREIKTDVETFLIRLTSTFPTDKSSSATLIVRVHKRKPAGTTTTRTNERYGFDPWFYGSVGSGFGYIWNYPIYIPIIIPPPGEIWPPDELPIIDPEPLPPGEIDQLPPDLLPPATLPEDFDFPEAMPLPADDGQLPLPEPTITTEPAGNLTPDMEPLRETDITPAGPWGFAQDEDAGFGDDPGDGFGGDFGGDAGGDFGGDF